jgi:hypothetical protein
VENFTKKQITDEAGELIPAEHFELVGVKFCENAVMPGLHVDISNPNVQSTIYLVFNYKDRIVNWKKIEFESTLKIAMMPEAMVPLSFILEDSSNLEITLDAWILKNARLKVGRSLPFPDEDEVEVILSVGYFVTSLRCPVSTLSSFIDPKPEDIEEWSARQDEFMNQD